MAAAAEANIPITEEYFKQVQFNGYDKRDCYVLKFFCNNGYFRVHFKEMCKMCNKVQASREHIVDECEGLTEWRKKMNKIIKIKQQKTILESMTTLFFRGPTNKQKTELTEAITELYVICNRKWKKEDLKEEKKEDEEEDKGRK